MGSVQREREKKKLLTRPQMCCGKGMTGSQTVFILLLLSSTPHVEQAAPNASQSLAFHFRYSGPDVRERYTLLLLRFMPSAATRSFDTCRRMVHITAESACLRIRCYDGRVMERWSLGKDQGREKCIRSLARRGPRYVEKTVRA